MKAILLVTTLALATTSFANLGETLPELKHRFKDSKYTTRIRGGVTVHIFTGTNRQVIVELIDGVSVNEIYNMNSPFSPAIMIDLMNVVAPGNTWHTGKDMPGDCMSDNGKFVAVLGDPPHGYTWSVAIGRA